MWDSHSGMLSELLTTNIHIFEKFKWIDWKDKKCNSCSLPPWWRTTIWTGTAVRVVIWCACSWTGFYLNSSWRIGITSKSVCCHGWRTSLVGFRCGWNLLVMWWVIWPTGYISWWIHQRSTQLRHTKTNFCFNRIQVQIFLGEKRIV